MADVDTSSYKQMPQNPFDTLGKTVGVANAVEQNKLLKGQQVQQNIGIDKSKLELAVSQLGQLRSLYAPLLNSPDVSSKDITNIGMTAIQQGMATPQQVATEIANFPKGGSAAERQAWVRNLYVRALSHEQQIGMMLGTPQGISTGGGTTFVQQPLRPDLPGAQRGAIPNTLPPTQPIINPETRQPGVREEGTPGQFQPSGGAPMAAPAVPQAVSPPPMPKPNAVVGAGPATGKNQSRFVPTELPVGERPAAEAAGAISGKQFADAKTAASDYRSRIQPIEKVVDLLEGMGPRDTGIGTETVNNVKNIAVGLGIMKADAAKPVEELKKYYMQNVLRGADIGTNEKLLSGISGNPNITLTKASASELAKADLALQRLKQAQTLEAIRLGIPENKFQDWAVEWNTKQDPRAYIYDKMSADSQKKLRDSLKGEERARFLSSLEAFHRMQNKNSGSKAQ